MSPAFRAQQRRFAPSVPLGAEVVKGGVRRCLLPGAGKDEKGKPEGSPHPWRGVRLPQVSDGDALTLVLPTPPLPLPSH